MLCQDPKDQSDLNFFFLSKKTRRGRKSNFQLPDGPRCTICLEFEEFSSEPIEKCPQCNSLFHLSCYSSTLSHSNADISLNANPKGSNFLCAKCTYANKKKRSIETIKCGICSMSTGIMEHEVHQTHHNGNDEDVFYHTFCKRLIPELIEESMDSLRKWRYKNSCHFCKAKLTKDQPVIKCLNSKCKEFYHIPCAIEKGMLFSIRFQAEFYNRREGESIPFYCSCHNKRLVTCYKEHMYECNRKSTRYSSDSHSHNDNDNDTIEETEKKRDKDYEDNGNEDKEYEEQSIVYNEPKEFRIDFESKGDNDNGNERLIGLNMDKDHRFPIIANDNDFNDYFTDNPFNIDDTININDPNDDDDLSTYFKIDLFKDGDSNNN